MYVVFVLFCFILCLIVYVYNDYMCESCTSIAFRRRAFKLGDEDTIMQRKFPEVKVEPDHSVRIEGKVTV